MEVAMVTPRKVAPPETTGALPIDANLITQETHGYVEQLREHERQRNFRLDRQERDAERERRHRRHNWLLAFLAAVTTIGAAIVGAAVK
jgi:hypothetical protein